MKIGRGILTHRQDMVPVLRDFYKDKTDFLVVAYNSHSVAPAEFTQTDRFKLFPYFGKGKAGNVAGQQYLVWKDIAKQYPDIDAWVMHDYDVLVRPSDGAIFSHISEGMYATIGLPFAIWQKGMKGDTTTDPFPFNLLHYYTPRVSKDDTFSKLEPVLLKEYPCVFEGVETIMTSYGDFIAANTKDVLRFDDPRLFDIPSGGAEQVPATVLTHAKLSAVDLRRFFKIKMTLDPSLFVDFDEQYDISHTVKFWPGSSVKPTLKQRLIRFLKPYVTKSFPLIGGPVQLKAQKGRLV